jgi:signal transduction histidine kinase
MARGASIEVSLPKVLERGARTARNRPERPLHMAEAITKGVQRVRSVLGEADAAIRVFLPDGVGRLRQAAVAGAIPNMGRKRSRRRRAAFDFGISQTIAPRGLPGYLLTISPLSMKGRRVGVLEVLAPAAVLVANEDAIAKAAAEAAVIVGQARDRVELKADLSFPAAGLIAEMVRASSAKAAVSALARFYFERFGVPVAAWLSPGTGRDAELVSVRGVGARKTAALRHVMSTFGRWDRLPVEQRDRILAKFAGIVEAPDVAVLHVGDAVLLAGAAGPAMERSMGVLGPLVGDVFDHLATVNWAERRNQDLDMGIALTAHEVRGPLLGARAAIDHVLTGNNGPGSDREMLLSSRLELERLAELVDSLLRWSVGTGPIRRRRTDLADVTREAVHSCSLEMGEERIRFHGLTPALVQADAGHLRVAIRNLVRNALAYSAADSEVLIALDSGGGLATVSVANEGPAIPAGEEGSIFDPFVRGEAALQTGTRGSGLGLFITRRIAEAHGGEVWVHSGPQGTTFYLQLPMASEKCRETTPAY